MRFSFVKLFLTFFICIGAGKIVFSQPINDNCSGAVSITPSKTCDAISGTMVGVTGPSYDVWYSFVATSTSHSIGVTKTADLNNPTRIFKPEVKLFTDCSGTTQITSQRLDFSTVGTPSPGQDHVERTFTNLTIGKTYYYTVSNIGSGYYNFNFDTYVCDFQNLGSVNDEVATAINLPINQFCQLQTFDMSGATKSATTIPLSATTGISLFADVWFKVTVPANGRVSLIVETQGVQTGIAMGLYKGTSPSNLVELSSDCLGCLSYSTSLSIDKSGLTPNDVLYVRIAATSSNTLAGTFKICATSPPSCGNHTPAGNLCANATHICDLNGYCGNTSVNYKPNAPGNLSTVLNSISIDNNSWLSFTANATEASFTVFVSNCVQVGSANGIQIQVFDATNCNNFVPKSALWSPGTVDNTVIYATNLVPGQDYLIFIDGANSAHCDYTISTNDGILLVDAGPDQTYCNPNTNPLVLHATGTGASTLNWSSRAGNVYTPNIGTSANLSINPGPTVNTEYIVEATGTCTGTKDSMLVTISNCLCVKPTINSQPRDTSVCSGATVTYKVGTTGATSFQWKESKDGGVTYLDLSNGGVYNGVTTNTLVLTNVTATNNNYKYKCVVKDITGKCSDSTTVLVLKVNSLPTATITTSKTVCKGDPNPNVVFTGSNGSANYIFTYTLNNGSNLTTLSTGNSATLSVSTSTVSTSTYNLISVKDANNCSQNQTGSVVITVDPTNVGGVVNSNHTVCSGTQSNLLTLTGNSGSVTKWQFAVSPFISWNDTAITAITFTSSNLSQATEFRAVIKSGACPEVYSTPALVSVDPKSIAGVLNSSKSICAGQTSSLISLSGNTGGVVKWQSATKPFLAWNDITNTSTSFTSPILNDSTKYRVIVKSGSCPADTSSSILIAVSPNQTLDLQCGNSTNSTVQFTWTKINGVKNYNYSYTINNTGSATTGSISANSIDTTIIVGGMGQIVNFTLTPVGATCVASETANCISTTCNKPVTNQLQDIVVCAGDNIDIPTFTSPDSTDSFSWTNSNSAIGLPIKGISDTLFKTALVTQQQVGIIKVNAYKSPCKGPTMTFKITVNPLPNVTTKLDTSICKGSSIQLKGGGATSYSWNNGISDNVSFAPTITNTYTVTGTDINNCKNTANVTITVNPLPVITVSNSGPICANDSSFILNQGGDALTKWSWKSNANAFFSDSLIKQPIVKKAINNEVFTLKGTDANGCFSSATTTLTINQLPVFNLATNSPCKKQTITLFCSSATAISYLWSNKNGYTNSQQNPTLSNCQLSDSGYYYLKFTDSKGCIKSDSIFVKINSLPVFTPSAISPCENTPFSVKANFLNASSYIWSGPVSLANTETVLVSNAANPTTHNGDYSVTVTDAKGCSNTNKVTVTVKPSPVISVTNNGPLCANDTTLSLNQTGDVLTKWSWTSNKSALFSDSLIKQPTLKNVSNGEVFTLKGTDANGCASSASTTLTVNPLPVFKISANSPCVGQTLNLNCDFVGAKNYAWTNVNVFLATSQNSIKNAVTLLDTGIYVLKLTDFTNCTDTHQVHVKINSLPNFNPSYLPPCEQAPLLMKANYVSNTAVKRYSWSGPPTLKDTIPSLANTIVTQHAIPNTHNGLYALTITDVNNCFNTKNLTVTINTLPTVRSRNDFGICIGDTVILNGSGAVSYSWDKNVVNNTPFTPLATASYIVKGTDNNSCQNIDTVTITVNPLPSITLSNLCETNVEFAQSNHKPSLINAWISSNLSVATIDPNSGKINALQAGKTTLFFTDSAGCKIAKDLTVFATPTILTNPLYICENSKVILKANQTGASINPWLSTSLNTTINQSTGEISGNKPGVDSISFTNSYGCKTTKLFTVYGLPTANFSSINEICIGDTLNLINTTSPMCDSYIWDFGDGSISSQASHNFTKSGFFNISLKAIDKYGCKDSIVKLNYIEVLSKPKVTFTFSPDSIDILNPEVSFTTNSDGKYFSWNFGDGKPISTTKDAVHLFPDDEGNYYTVTLTASNTKNGCSNSYSQVIVSKEPLIYYIPNTFTPNGDEINNTFQPIFSSGLDPYNYGFYIYDRWGELIFESHNVKIGWDGSYNNEMVGSNTFIWKLEFKEKQNQSEHLKVGHVNVIR